MTILFPKKQSNRNSTKIGKLKLNLHRPLPIFTVNSQMPSPPHSNVVLMWL